MKRLCENLKECALKKIKFKKTKKMELLTEEWQQSDENAKICYSCKEKTKNKYVKDKKYCKIRDLCHYTGEYRAAVYSIFNSYSS